MIRRAGEKKCHIEISERVTQEITSCIAEGLDRFNDQHIGYGDRLPLAVVVRDPDSGEVLGGITGRSSLGLLFLELFYLPEALRGAGLGSELLRRFEQEGAGAVAFPPCCTLSAFRRRIFINGMAGSVWVKCLACRRELAVSL